MTSKIEVLIKEYDRHKLSIEDHANMGKK